jgi:hypothetical protein
MRGVIGRDAGTGRDAGGCEPARHEPDGLSVLLDDPRHFVAWTGEVD